MYEADDDRFADTDSFLHFARKRLLHIPVISNPWSIKRLDLDYNNLISLDGISQFKNLERLSIIENRLLISFPPEFKKLNKLNTLLMDSVKIDSFDNLPSSVTILSLVSSDAKESDWDILFHLKQILKSNKLKILSIHIHQFEKMLYDATIDDMQFLKTLLFYEKIDVINIEPDRTDINNQEEEEFMTKYDKRTIKDKIAIRLNELNALIEFRREKEEEKGKGKEEDKSFDEKKINDEINDLKKKYNIKNSSSSSSSSSNNSSNSNTMYLSASTKLSDIVKTNTQYIYSGKNIYYY